MCVGENCAPQAVHYINAQLSALYDNAVDCLKHHGNAQRPGEQFKYSHALAEFSFGKIRFKDQNPSGFDTMFHARFDKPRLEFICSHDAVLRMKIREGHYHLDHSKVPTLVRSDSERVQLLSDLELAFRVSFDASAIRGKDFKIGNGQNLIRFIVLDLPKAQLVSTTPDIMIGRDALVFYLKQYLELLQNAGNHVLFSLPDFDDDRYRLTIDYSLMGSSLLDVDEIHGVPTEKINTYLSSVWLKAAMLVGEPTGQEVDWRQTCLAEYRSTSTVLVDSDVHFHVKMGAPRIKPVCSREAVLFFSIDEVLFYNNSDFTVAPSQRYTGWEIALIVDIVHEKEHDGNITRCKLDLATARIHNHYCTFTDFDDTDEDAVMYWRHFVDFLTNGYLDILEGNNFHVIYYYDARWTIARPGIDHDEGSSEEEENLSSWEKEEGTNGAVTTKLARWKRMVTSSNMFGFDQIVAISQASLNAFFNSQWVLSQSARSEHTSVLSKWAYEQYFSATFKPVTLRLLSNGRAIVWINLEAGHMKTLKNWLPWVESEQYRFEGWHLAFEVDLKTCAHEHLEGVSSSWLTKYQDCLAFKHHGNSQDRYLKHLYLDLRSAEFIHEYSTFEGLFQSPDRHPIDKVQAVVHYIRTRYFPHLTQWGLNILHTVPLFKSGTSLPSYALTNIDFHVYSKASIHRHNWAQVPPALEPAIVILGMTGFKPLPSTHLEFSANWVARVNKGISYGTVSISRNVFMDQRLLKLLARVNAVTTVIPLFHGVENDVWKLHLTTWAQHEFRRNRPCDWKLDAEKDGYTKYKWEHRDGWSYEHEGSSDIVNGAYTVSCLTRNFVEIPTAVRNSSLNIKVWGELSLEMSFKSTTRSGSAKSSAKWDTTLSVQTHVDGIKINVVGSPSPAFSKTVFNGEFASTMFTDLRTDLQAHLPGTIDLNEVLQELRAFEGVWQYCYPGMQGYCLANPVFNVRGDLLFELKPYSQQTGAASVSGSRHASVNGHMRKSSSRSTLSPHPSVLSKPSLFKKAKELIQGNGSTVAQSNGNGNGHHHMTYAAATAREEHSEETETSFLVSAVE
ncbi:hypothetical protein AcW1_007702 [Taiwanofungus camphoratus]|nr:hypothetical protein AcW2_007237 [Antrodia cinnamomea]KAI0947482.1 hypothetical protein AcV7_009903 [Antrodia cinnamomea]KAI0953500.1 hypothetical protein AcW1_007702 [Antrodia cinnamomea]